MFRKSFDTWLVALFPSMRTRADETCSFFLKYVVLSTTFTVSTRHVECKHLYCCYSNPQMVFWRKHACQQKDCSFAKSIRSSIRSCDSKRTAPIRLPFLSIHLWEAMWSPCAWGLPSPIAHVFQWSMDFVTRWNVHLCNHSLFSLLRFKGYFIMLRIQFEVD